MTIIGSLTLILIGFILIFIEFFVPGAVIGVIGGVMVFVGLAYIAVDSQSLFIATITIITVIIGLIYLIRFSLWRIRTAKPNKSIYSADHQGGFQACSYDESLIGKNGVTATDLRPSGQILIEGKRLQAISQNNYIVKGTNIIVIGGQEGSLIVKSIKESS